LESLRAFIRILISLVKSVPDVCKAVFAFVASRSPRQWMIAGGVLAYYYLIRWIHQVLEAGPLVVILTMLTLIFTIGLSDNENRDGISAYSVFNRGFERLLGSVDVDSLLAQHVGGGLGGGGGGMIHHEERPHYRRHGAERPAPNERNERNERNNNNDNDDHGAVNNDHDEGGQDNDDDDPNRARTNDDNQTNHTGSRKSGKKARRRNLEQRRDLRRQREAALQMGLDGGEGPEEMMAMQRLIEEQIAAAEE